MKLTSNSSSYYPIVQRRHLVCWLHHFYNIYILQLVLYCVISIASLIFQQQYIHNICRKKLIFRWNIHQQIWVAYLELQSLQSPWREHEDWKLNRRSEAVVRRCSSKHCVKSVRIRSYSGLPAFGLNCLSVFSPNAGKCGPE